MNSDSIAHAVISYAMSTALINGKSKGNFRPATGALAQ